MLIGIDGNEANVPERVGVNVFAYEILRNIYKLQDEWKNRHKIIVYLKDTPLPDLPKESENFIYKILSGKKLWVIRNLMPHLLFGGNRPDILFSPSHYVPPISFIPIICSIMDVGFLNFKGQFKKFTYWQLKYWTAWSINISKKIIAISNSTKEEVVRNYKIQPSKIVVTYPGFDSEKFNVSISRSDVLRVRKKYAIVGDYILFLSTLKPSKNVEGLLHAWNLISKEFPQTKLVIAGKKGWMYDSIFRKVKKLKLDAEVIFTGFVKENHKQALIKGAKAFVLPSFWEGFGLDAVNSMACGVPVVVSNVGSLPEVIGDSGIYVDPFKPSSIAAGIKKILSATKLEYNKGIVKGVKQANKFSWEKTARQVLKVLEECSQKK